MVQFDLKKLFHIPTAAERLKGLHLRPDLTAAAAKMIIDERSDGELKKLDSCLRPSETVIAVVEGRLARQMGLLTLTTERVCFRQHGSAPSALTNIPLADISTVDDEVKTMTGRLILRSTDSIAEIDKILGAQAASFAEAVRHQLINPGALPEHDPIQELLNLRDRKAAGTISEADYNAVRSRLLDEL
jgi:Bacterial PH domain